MAKRLTLIALLAALLHLTATAQVEVVVADGTETTQYYPLYGYWADADQHVQLIYPASMLTELVGSSIESMSFHVASGTCEFGSTTITLGTPDADVDLMYEWSEVNDPVTVYSGATTIVGSLLTFTFSETYTYTGGDLLVDLQYETADEYNDVYFYGTSTSSYTAGIDYSDYGQPDYYDMFLPKVTFSTIAADGCLPVSGLTVTGVGPDYISVSWVGNESAVSYLVYLDGEESSTTDTFYTFSNLEQLSSHTIQVRSYCGDDTSAARNKNAMTITTPYSELPYSTSFEEEQDTAWIILNGTNGWVIDSAVHCGEGLNALYISHTDGDSNTYDIESPSVSYAIRLFYLEEGSYTASFDWHAMGETDYDYMRAWIAPAAALSTLSANHVPGGGNYNASVWISQTPAGWTSLHNGQMGQKADWQNLGYVFDIAADGNYMLVITWFNDGSLGNQPAAAIDNVRVSTLTCSAPTNFMVDAIDTTGFAFHWTPGADESAWLVAIDGQEPQSVSDTTFAFADGDANTAYGVRVYSLCSNGDTSLALFRNIRTSCGIASNLPVSEGFEDYADNEFPSCWERAYTNANGEELSPNDHIYVSSNNASDGTKSLYLYSCNQYEGQTTQSTVALPPLAAELTGLSLSFDYRYPGSLSDNRIEVGVVDYNMTFFPVDTVELGPSSGTWYDYEGSLALLPDSLADGTRIAVRYSYLYPNDWWSCYFDNFRVFETPSCTRPASVSVSGLSDTSATFTINDPLENGSYHVVVLQGSDTVASIFTEETTVGVDTLQGGTVYTVQASSICAEDNTETSVVSSQFTTQCSAEAFPFHFTDADMLAVQNPGFSVCWDWSNFYRASSSGIGYVYSSSSTSEFRLPPVDVDLSTAQLRTTVSTTSSNVSFRVGVREGNTTVWVDTISLTTSSQYLSGNTYEVPLSSYTGTGNRVVVGTMSYNTVYFFDFHVEPISNCVAVGNVGVSNIGETTATVSWTANGEESEWVVYVDGVETATVSSPSYDMTGLNASTGYTVGIRALCGDGDTSSERTVHFITSCSAISDFPWEENFDEIPSNYGQIVNGGYQYLNCWSMKTGHFDESTGTASLSDPTFDIFYVNSYAMGSTNLKVNIYGEDNYRWLITPQLALGSEASLSFHYALTDFSSSYAPSSVDTDDKFYVLASRDGSTWDIVYGWGGNTTDYNALLSSVPATPDSINIDLGTYAGDTIFLAFYGESTVGGSDNDFHIDNIRVLAEAGDTVAPGPGPQPQPCNAPTVTNITSTETSATLTWTSTASNFEVAIVEGAWSEPASPIAVTGTQHTFTGLTASTQYTAGVRTVCDDGQKSTWATRNISTASSDSTGIDDAHQLSSNISLYPNPASSSVTVGLDVEASIAIIDINGRTVLSVKAQGTTTIDLGDLAGGTYFVRIATADQTTTRRLIVR